MLVHPDVIIDGADNLVARVIIYRMAQILGFRLFGLLLPPFKEDVMSFTLASVAYEIVLEYLSYQQELTLEMQNRIHDLKDGRALYSVQHGADKQWANSYINKERSWAVLSPITNMVGILASFEAFKCIINRENLQPILSPNLIQVNLAYPNMVQVCEPETGSWNYTTLSKR